MDLVNGTSLSAAYTLGLDPDGTERIVVALKGTFTLPADGRPPTLAPEQDPLVFADTFTGKPGFSSVVYESDLAPVKPRCDVLLLGSAYPPHGREATTVDVALRVGTMTKGFEVVGHRHWTAGVLGISTTRPTPFTKMPISYDRAFGGPGDPVPGKPGLTNAYAANPVGVGYFKRARDEDTFGRPLPNTQEVNDGVSSPTRAYRPMAFGPIGRNFSSRVALAGTYDQAWVDDVFPFLPADFRPEYYQAAPPEQQIAHPVGGETVQLLNMTPRPHAPFELPRIRVPVELTRDGTQRFEQEAVLDTLVFEPDRQKIQFVWRTSLPLRDSIREITQVVIGRMPLGWYRARSRRKEYFRSIDALAASRRKERKRP